MRLSVSKRSAVTALLVILGLVAIARWTVLRAHPSAAPQKWWASVLIGAPQHSGSTSLYVPPSNVAWTLPRVLSLSHRRGQVIGVHEAEAVFQAFWPARERAAAMLDIPMLQRLDTGAALRADLGLVHADWAARDYSRPERSGIPENIVVPTQTSYPAWFMVRVHVGSRASMADPQTPDGFEEILILSKATATGDWKLASDVTFDPRFLPAWIVGTRETGLNSAPPSREQGLRELAALSDYYQHWFTHHAAPAGTRFTPGPGTTQQGIQIGGEEPGVRLQRIATQPNAADVFTLKLDDGWTLACGDIRSIAIAQAQPGTYLIQQANRANWGDALAPGQYSQITSAVLRQVCIAKQSPAGAMLVYGGRFALTAVTGKTLRSPPARPNPFSPPSSMRA
jgi:hypothetical protein